MRIRRFSGPSCTALILIRLRALKCRCRGFSLIEQALVLPILLFFILGAMDLNDAMQSYNALAQGAKVALRCQYTLDGDCLSQASASPARLFNWYDARGSASYVFNAMEHDASVSWLESPTYDYQNISARVLQSVHFSIPRTHYLEHRPFWATESAVDFALKAAEGPYLKGTDPHNPEFVFPRQNTRDYATQVAVTTFGGSSATPANPEMVVARFQVSRPPFPSQSSCFLPLDSQFNRDPADSATNFDPLFSRPCPSEELTAKVQIALHARGMRNVSAGSTGHLVLRLRKRLPDNRWGAWRQIGGQIFRSGVGAENFYPRGVPPARMDHQIAYDNDGTLRREFQDDNQINIKVDYDTVYQLGVYMDEHSGGGTIAWRATDVRVYTPTWIPVQTRYYPCDQLLPADMQGCTLHNQGVPEELPRHSPRHQIPEQKLYPEAPREFRDCENRYVNGTARPAPSPSAGYELVELDCSVSGPRSCPAIGQSGAGGTPNYGVAQLPDSSGHIVNSATAEAICPAAIVQGASQNDDGAMDIHWTEHNAQLPAPLNQYTWAKHDCSATLQLPASYRVYPKLLPLVLSSSTYERLDYAYSQERTPAWLKQQDSLFSCDEIRLGQTFLDESLPAEPDHDCLFRGAHPDYGSCTAERLRADAIEHHAINPADWFQTQNSITGRVAEAAQPTDECTPFNTNYTTLERTLLTDQPLPEGQIPATCQDPNRTIPCQVKFYGFSGAMPVDPEFNQDTARAKAFEAIRAAMPRARSGCSGDYCAQMNLATLGEGTQRKTLRASFGMDVPLRLLLNRTLRVNYHGQEVWEGEMVE